MFTRSQLEQIYQGKHEGVNADVYSDPSISSIDMWLVRKTLLQSPELEELITRFVLNQEVTKHMKDYKIYNGLWAIKCLHDKSRDVIALAFQPEMTTDDVNMYVYYALSKYGLNGHKKKLMNKLRKEQFSKLRGNEK